MNIKRMRMLEIWIRNYVRRGGKSVLKLQHLSEKSYQKCLKHFDLTEQEFKEIFNDSISTPTELADIISTKSLARENIVHI